MKSLRVDTSLEAFAKPRVQSDPRSGRDNVLPTESAIRRYMRVTDRNNNTYEISPNAGSAVQYPRFEGEIDDALFLILPRVVVKLEEIRLAARRISRKNDAIVRRRLCEGIAKEVGVKPVDVEPLFKLTVRSGAVDAEAVVFQQANVEATKRIARLFWISRSPQARSVRHDHRDMGKLISIDARGG